MSSHSRLLYPERKIWEPILSVNDRIELGKAQRKLSPRESHAVFKPSEKRSDPIQLLVESSVRRVPELVPIRYGRMLNSSFAFLRGAAVIMAEDLASTSGSGVYVQCCGDCHLMNFGGYATPERNQIFDINDFDETLPAPFEWDLKRLAASFVVAGRYKGYSEKDNLKFALTVSRTYAEKIREFSGMRQLELWYNRLDEATILDVFKKDKELVKRIKEVTEKARQRTHEFVFPRISAVVNGKRKIIDDPPLIYHLENSDELINSAFDFFENYYKTMANDRKSLLGRYRIEDIAIKVVGVGSVGTSCFIGLFVAGEKDAIILQFKEANSSVLEKFAGNSEFKSHGERIVNGQRLMQTVSDIFLGWTKIRTGVDYYVRQLRDMKASANLETFTPTIMDQYAYLCGWALAKSHAKAGRSPEITGYIGQSDVFPKAISEFALAYANQTEDDFKTLQTAEKEKRIIAIRGK